MKIKTLVIGASPNPSRYSYMAVMALATNDFPVVPFGVKRGEIHHIEIVDELPKGESFHTVSFYIRPELQGPYLDYLFRLKPSRVLIPPGAENPELEEKLAEAGIFVEHGCTMVMVGNGLY